MQIARSKIGQHEIPGRRDNSFILECFRHTTLHSAHDEVPWCAAFVSYCLDMSGVRSARSAAAMSYAHYGRPCQIFPGAILVFRWPGGSHHVTFCDHVVDHSRVACLGGNQNNSVNVSIYEMRYLVAVRWP
jgi:uncharacterized protein (TIGR02594 family)